MANLDPKRIISTRPDAAAPRAPALPVAVPPLSSAPQLSRRLTVIGVVAIVPTPSAAPAHGCTSINQNTTRSTAHTANQNDAARAGAQAICCIHMHGPCARHLREPPHASIFLSRA